MSSFGLILLAIAAALLAFDIGLRIKATPEIAQILETVPPFSVSVAPADTEAIDIEFPSSDGLTLAGSLYLPDSPRGVVVFCHELYGNRWTAMRYCRPLFEAGYAVLSFDYRNHGSSDQLANYEPTHWLTQYEVSDTMAALEYVRRDEALAGIPIGLFGVSRGGSAALAVAAQCPDIQVILADGAFSLKVMVPLFVRQWGEIYVPRWLIRNVPMWHLKSVVALASWASQRRKNCRYFDLESMLPRLADRKVLLISGKRDSYVKPAVTKLLASRIGSGCGVWVVPQAKHNKAVEIDPREYAARSLALFDSAFEPQQEEPDSRNPVEAGHRRPQWLSG